MGQAFTQFQPDNVFLSKAKGRVNPFGAKAVFKWEYGPDGTPRQTDGTDNQSMGFPSMGGNNFIDRMRARIQSRFTPSMGGDIPEGVQTSTPASMAPEPGSTSTSPYVQYTPTGGSGMAATSGYDENMFATPPAPPAPPVRYNPLPGTLEDIPQQFAGGGNAGKLVLKQSYMPDVADFARGYSTVANGIAGILNNRGIMDQESQIYNPMAFMPTMPEGLPDDRGDWGVGSLIAERQPNLQPLGYGTNRYNNMPMNELSGATIGRYGGSYQVGGMTGDYQVGQTYDVSDDELDQLIKGGATFTYE
jgi:hypothetical protein